MTPWERLWNRMMREEQRQAAREVIVQSAKMPEAAASILKLLVEGTKNRADVVARWSTDKQADYLTRIRMGDLTYASFVATFLVKFREPMLARMLDVAEIPNVNGVVDIRTQTQPIPTERLAAGIRAIEREFPARDVEFYLDAIEAQRQSIWKNLADAMKLARTMSRPPAPDVATAPAASTTTVATGEAVPNGATVTPPPPPPPLRPLEGLPPTPPRVADDPPIERGEVHLADVERLSPLDTFVRDGLVATAAGELGALSVDQMRGLVEELIEIKPTRHRSWFHLGFLDVCERLEPDLDVAQASERNRGWYLAGVIAAYEMRGDRTAIVRMFDRHTAEARRILGDRHEATIGAIGPLVEAMCAAGRSEEAISALASTAVSKGGEKVYDALIAEAEARLAASKKASTVLKLLVDALDAGVRRQDRTRPGLADEIAVLQATTCRVSGDFDRAAEFLRGVGVRGDAAVVARTDGERGLVACRVRSLSEIRLPLVAADLAATAARLEPGVVHFERASVRANPRRCEADFAVGIYRLARGDLDGARAALEQAVASFRAGAVVTEGVGTPARARFALGVVLAETLDVLRAEDAVDLLVSGATELPGEVPAYALARALAALATIRAEFGVRVIAGLAGAMGDRLVDIAIESDLVAAHEGVREALAIRTEDASRSPRARGDDAARLLRDSLSAHDIGRATRALCVLDDLADHAEGRGRLLSILADRERYAPAWNEAEAVDARVRLYESDQRFADAARELTDAAHDALSKDPERGLVTAREFVGAIAGYGVGSPDAGLIARIEALGRVEAAEPPARVRHQGRVFVIGGNEVQARYEASIRGDLAGREPAVALDFDFTGWSSNWGRSLGTIERRIAEADAVVVMRFIRTMLGRTVRELAGRHGKPWVACTGHGRDSLSAAIGRAIVLLPGA